MPGPCAWHSCIPSQGRQQLACRNVESFMMQAEHDFLEMGCSLGEHAVHWLRHWASLPAEKHWAPLVETSRFVLVHFMFNTCSFLTLVFQFRSTCQESVSNPCILPNLTANSCRLVRFRGNCPCQIRFLRRCIARYALCRWRSYHGSENRLAD